MTQIDASIGRIACSAIATCSMALAACGEGGGTIASASMPIAAPQVPASAPPAAVRPSQTSGTYLAISTQPGQLTITVDKATGTYSLTSTDPTILPVNQASLTQVHSGSGLQGTTLPSGDRVKSYLWLWQIGSAQHVDMGEWLYQVLAPAPDDTEKKTVLTYFVFGDRTPAADMPLTGRATYSRVATNLACDCYATINLSADFGAGSIATTLAAVGQMFDGRDHDLQASGQGSISTTGTFGLGLAGTSKAAVTSGGTETLAVNGRMDGAFFGPKAGEIGGAFALQTPQGDRFFGTFAGAKD
ncbi:transferrin-binding protein-like solute binding protein [Novosphingobium flavum]|uniref:Transferrin-binding protein-like solute binding protein n=1 Tax=Novosphingobium flavum TaxID=1778672 RepID=A0A7X1KKE9_9SPHN|nr:transferrin-binding protein-like solute binding protein [Novosphingobium flavum]MBC2664481.1 transferrin-binding protein-like solute binding protein [Novosphingobium flavum]